MSQVQAKEKRAVGESSDAEAGEIVRESAENLKHHAKEVLRGAKKSIATNKLIETVVVPSESAVSVSVPVESEGAVSVSIHGVLPPPSEPRPKRMSLSLHPSHAKEVVTNVMTSAAAAFNSAQKDDTFDPEDDPSYANKAPQWEDDIGQDPDYADKIRAQLGRDIPYASNAASSSTAPSTSSADNLSGPTLQMKIPETLARHRWKKAYQFVRRQNAMKKKALSTPIGTGATMEGHALGFISIESETRASLFNFWYNEKTEYLLLGVIASHIFVLILKAENKFVTSFHPTKSQLDVADIVLTSFYTFEAISKILTLGFIRGPHTYLRNSYNTLDLIIVIDSWVHIIRTIVLKKDVWLRLATLRVFRALLILRHFSFIGNVLAIMDAITKSVVALETVIVFTLIILSFYGLVGVIFFNGNLRMRCVRQSDEQISFPEKFCTISRTTGDTCPTEQEQLCSNLGNPNWGATSFDNYAAAFLTLFQILSFEGWSLLMYNMKDTDGSSEAYYIILVVIGSYFLVNIFVAAISGVFLRVRQEHQILLKKYRRDKAFSFANAITMAKLLKEVILSDDAKLTWRQRMRRRTMKLSQKFSQTLRRQSTRLRRSMSRAVDWNDPNSYLKRISSFGLTGTAELSEGMPEHDEQPLDQSMSGTFSRTLSRNLSGGARSAARFGHSISRHISMQTLHAAQNLSKKCQLIVQSKIFVFAELFFISLNMAGLCSLKANMSSRHRDNILILEAVMLCIFAAELILRFLAAGLVNFIDERMNLIDALVVCVSIGAVASQHVYPNITPIRMLRWFYQKKRHDEEESGSILAAILRSTGAMASVFFFLLLIILVFSVISMELWGGQFNNFEEGYPRANYDTFLQAMITWFSVTTAESWPNEMWNSMRPGVKNRWVAPFLYVLYFMITAYVILNLIIATILEETELTDNQKKHIQKREHLKWLHTKHLHHVSSTRSSDWLVGAVEGAQRGITDMRRRMSTMRVSRMSLFPVLQPDTGFVRMVPAQSPEPVVEDRLPKRSRSALPTIEANSSRRLPFTTVDIPGSTAESDKTKARILRRSSTGALNAIGLMTSTTVNSPMRRRPSQLSDKVILRTGFNESNFATTDGANRTALQAALLAVVDEQAMVAKLAKQSNKEESKLDPVQDPYGRTPSRKKVRTSFVLSDYEGIEGSGEKVVPWYMSPRSLFLFNPGSKVRAFCNRVIDNIWYQWWQIFIAAVSIFVVIETGTTGVPLILYGTPFLPILDYIVLAVFSIDLIIKSAAYGFLFTPEAYLGDPYNFVDLFNLIVHILNLRKTSNENWQRAFRILMAVRPTRLISRFQGLRTLMTSLLHTIPAITQIFCFTIVVYAIYAVIGVQLYANRFISCSDSSVAGHAQCVGMFMNDSGLWAPRTWYNPPFHFDDFGQGMLAIFVASTFDNWLSYFLYTSMDLAHKEELQPQRNISPSHALFFISFVCIGGFFTLRMFVGVFIDQFGIISGTKLLTERQKLWRDTNRLIQSLKPVRLPQHLHGCIRSRCYKILHSRYFQLLVMFVVITNYVYIAAQHYNQAQSVSSYDKSEIMFVSLYLIEAVLKLVGTEIGDWWHDKWNAAELIIALVSAACINPTEINQKRKKVAGFFQVIRIFRVIRYFPALNTMVRTVAVSLPSMVDIMGLMGIVLFAMAQVGTQVFNNIRDGSCINNQGNLNFSSFMNSFVMLFQITTLDNWSCIMTDISIDSPNCVVGVSIYENDCGFPAGGRAYMIILVCLTTHIFANLFVAQILDSITFGLLNENALLTPAHLVQYQVLWAQGGFDHECTGYIGLHKLREFVERLGPPLGRRKVGFAKWYSRIQYEAYYFRNEKGIPFRSLLETLCLYKVGPRGLELPLRIEREKQIHAIYKEGAAIKIQGLVRGFLQRRRNKKGGPSDIASPKDGDKRYSENPDAPPDIVFDDPTQFGTGHASHVQRKTGTTASTTTSRGHQKSHKGSSPSHSASQEQESEIQMDSDTTKDL